MASAHDLDTVLDVLGEAAAWATARGFENWPARFSEGFISRTIADGEVFVAERAGHAAATITLEWHDTIFWGTTPPDAGYVHRLAVRTADHGAGIGIELLGWAAEQVRTRGCEWLRLDVSTDNVPLRRYYERIGFGHCRDVEGVHTRRDGTRTAWKTSLYQRRVIAQT